MTKVAYPEVEAVMDVLCNFLIVEKRDTQYTLNSFAEKYIVGRFIPDAEIYNELSAEITPRQREVQRSLKQLNEDIKNRPYLANIMRDWLIVSDIDRITAAKMYRLYSDVRLECQYSGKFLVSAALENFLRECREAEKLTAHPYIKYQRARIFQMIDAYNILQTRHTDEIRKSFSDSIYAINTIAQYNSIIILFLRK